MSVPFVVSISSAFENWRYALEMPYPDGALGFELCGELMDAPELPALLAKASLPLVAISDPVPRGLAAKVSAMASGRPGHPGGCADDFARACARAAERARDLGAQCVSIDFCLASAPHGSHEWTARMALLKRVATLSYRLPVRVLALCPASASLASYERVAPVATEAMSPRVGLAVEFPPLRMAGGLPPAAALRALRFDAAILRLRLAPDLGAQAVPAALEWLLAPMRELRMEMPVTVAPEAKSFPVFEAVISAFVDAIESAKPLLA